MAKLIGVSATYLSKVERDEFTPPTEDKVRRLAELLDCDADELIMMAGRMPSDLTEIIRERPRELAALLRTAKSLTKEELERFHRNAQKIRDTD
jgi:transcriptional regulator with XRE-family HTH domain